MNSSEEMRLAREKQHKASTNNKFGDAQPEPDKRSNTENCSPSGSKPPLPAGRVDASTNSGKIVEGQPTDDLIAHNRSDEATSATEKERRLGGGKKRRRAQPTYELYHRIDGFWGWRDTRDPSLEGVLAGDKATAELILGEMNLAHESEHLPPREAVGELAQLKSGGPVMTITGASQPGKMFCTWFRGGLAKMKYFPTKALRIPQPKKGLRHDFGKHAKKKDKQKAEENTATNSTTSE